MNIESHKRRIIVLLLMLAMVFTAMPTVSLAASNSSDSYDRISTAKEFISGTYVMVVYTGYAVGPMDGTWLSAVDVGKPDGVDKITNPGSATVEITVEGSSAKIKLSDENFIAPKGGNNNGIKAAEYQWAWTEDNGKFVFSGTGEDTVHLASNTDTQYGNKFRGYKTTTAERDPDRYPYQFTLYKLSESGSGTDTVAAPQAVPQSGTVEKGTTVALNSVTQGVQIYYTLDGSNPSDASNQNRRLYSDDNKPVINEDCVLKAVAVLGDSYSQVQEISYAVSDSKAGRWLKN